jgi:hypothetical protein
VGTRLALVFVGLLVAAGAVTGVVMARSGGGGTDGLPAIDGAEPPLSYRIVYDVITPDAQSSEERVVHRPFGARVTTRDRDGNVTSERWSELGSLVTRSPGAPATSIATAVAPAASDLRPDEFTEQLVEAERLVRGAETEVRGRACRSYKEASTAGTLPGEGGPAVGDVGTVPVVIDRCIDAIGLVLEERWTTAGGERVLTKRASTLELGDDVAAIEIPEAEPLALEQGNGSIREVDDDATPPFPEVFALPEPDGFTFVGRYAVTPPRLGGGAGSVPDEPDVTLYTDVWRRGGDLLLFDQGASSSGRLPFDDGTGIEDLELPGLGAATLAVDLRGGEVRLTRPDGGFVRIAGTIPLDELRDLAATITTVEAAAG